MTWIYMYYLTLGWLFMSYLCMCIVSAATFWHIEHRGLFSLNYWLVNVESTKSCCCIKKKVSHLTFLDRKVQCQGHISLLFFDDCCWYSLTAVQRLQWSKADSFAWRAGCQLTLLPRCAFAKNAVIKWKGHLHTICCCFSPWRWVLV